MRDDVVDDTHDKLLWKWIKGDLTVTSEFGDPVNTTEYVLCVYDTTASTPGLVLGITIPPGGTCADDKPCWKATGTKGFKYKDNNLTQAGVRKLILRAGAPGQAKIVLKGKGGNLPLPPMPLAQDPVVTVQVANTVGSCWEAIYSAPAIKTDLQRFKDRGD